MQPDNAIAAKASQPQSDVRRAPRLCMIGLDDYPHLTGENRIQHIGGESVQHLLLGRAWRQLGLDVSLIVFDEGQPKVHEVEGIRTIAICGQRDGLPGVKFIHPRGTSLLAAMRLADADIYYQSNANYITGLLAGFCRRHAKRFVFRISSDLYCIPGRQQIRLYHDRKIYEYGLRRADLILAQTQHQRQLLRTNYGLDSELANIAGEPAARARGASDIDVLWVGTLRAVKRPDLVIELARRLPHLRFVVVGGGEGEHAGRMREATQQLANLTYTGAVAYREVGAYFDRARLLLNTSSFEGFPNAFLQAWMRAAPVVTFVDPDGLVASKALGVVARDIDDMAHALMQLSAHEQLRRRMGERAAVFASDHYSAEVVARRYIELFSARFGGVFEHERFAEKRSARRALI